MNKTTLALILSVALSTKPQFGTLPGVLAEIAIFLIAVIMGTGVRIAMKAKSREGVTSREAGIVFFFGLSLGGLANYIMIFYGWVVPRPAIVWGVSLLAEFLLLWLEKRYPKLFDGILKKTTGIDVNNISKTENKLPPYLDPKNNPPLDNTTPKPNNNQPTIEEP